SWVRRGSLNMRLTCFSAVELSTPIPQKTGTLGRSLRKNLSKRGFLTIVSCSPSSRRTSVPIQILLWPELGRHTMRQCSCQVSWLAIPPSPDIAQCSLGYCRRSLTGIDVQHVDARRAPTSKTQAGGILSLRFSSSYLSCTEPS